MGRAPAGLRSAQNPASRPADVCVMHVHPFLHTKVGSGAPAGGLCVVTARGKVWHQKLDYHSSRSGGQERGESSTHSTTSCSNPHAVACSAAPAVNKTGLVKARSNCSCCLLLGCCCCLPVLISFPPCLLLLSQKSCRLRWYNQLCPGVKRTPFSEWEQAVIIKVRA